MSQIDTAGMATVFASTILDLFFSIWYVIPILILPAILKTAWFKGIYGEFLVNLMLKRLPSEDYHLIKNVTLPTEENGTTQIDHVLVSRFGIFIIETKNYRGWIFGSARQKQWTQKIFKNTYKFQNPIHQNYKHLKTLESLLCINKSALFSVIVFIGDSKFKTKMPDNVTDSKGFLSYIKAHHRILLSPQKVKEVIVSIESDRLKQGFPTNKIHNKNVKAIIEKKKYKNYK